MQISENNEINFIFKINKITHLLNHIDVYYQKEILKDIKRYNFQVNNNFNNIQNQDEKKKVTYHYLNKYLDNIINDHLDYLIESYHKNKKNTIIIEAEKKALKSININSKNKVTENIDSSVNNIKQNLVNNINVDTNENINTMLNNKINSFFDKIKVELFENVQYIVDKKIDNINFNKDNNSSINIDKRIKDLLKLFFEDDKVYNDIVGQVNNEVNNIYDILKKFQNEQNNVEVLIEKYILSNENKIKNIEKNIVNKINLNFENKIKMLTEIFNKSISNSLNNISVNNLNEKSIIKNIESKIINNSNFSKNNFQIKHDKENNEIQLYYFNDLITSTKLNLRGLIGPKGPQGIKGEKGDMTLIRNIKVNDDDTIKFIMQNGSSVYEVNTENKIPRGPKGDKGISGDKGDPGDVNINLKWNQDNVMKINKENFNNLIFLKSLSIGENSHCLKNDSLSIGNSICYKENSMAIGKNSKVLNENSIAFFGNTIGKNSFSYLAEDVDENCINFGNKIHNKYNIENISLKAKEIVLDCDDLILKDNNFKNNKIVELEEKVNYLIKEINDLKK